MSLAVYVKANPEEMYLAKIIRKRKDRAFGVSISLVGFFAVIFATWPVIVWNSDLMPKLSSTVQAAPIPEKKVLSVGASLGGDVQVAKDADGFSYFTTDFKPSQKRPSEFYLSVPKMKIEDAVVKVDSNTFEENLALFPGTAIPGEVGNAFITGHSTLPQFNDPKDYKAIFTSLPNLEIGDTVYAKVDGKTYVYLVQYKKVVDPKDISVLAPIAKGAKTLTLMTCVPPGTSLKRLIVVASLI